MEFTICPSHSISKILEKLHSDDILILEDGIYNEKIEIMIPNIVVRAKHPQKAILRNKDYYHKIMPDGNECNTFRTYTLYIGADHVTLDGLVIENTATPSSIYGQAVALHVDGNFFVCNNCTIQGAQDTLFTGPMPPNLLERYQGFYPIERLKGNPSKQKYTKCKIIGDVDFIFGCATVLFEDCEIISLKRNSSTPSYICAPAHSKELPFGYMFYKCSFSGDEPAFLARPWRDYGCAAFIECKMGEHILPIGYNKWNDTSRDKTARFYEYTPTVDTSSRASWSHQMSKKDAKKYLLSFMDFLCQK